MLDQAGQAQGDKAGTYEQLMAVRPRCDVTCPRINLKKQKAAAHQ